jgi:Phycobilisome degradation protein nblA
LLRDPNILAISLDRDRSSFTPERSALCQKYVTLVNDSNYQLTKSPAKLMELPVGLTIEQEFSLKIQAEQVKELNHEQTQACLIAVLRQLAIKENVVVIAQLGGG